MTLIMGDFNSFLKPSEKRGGDDHFQPKIASFKQFTDAVGFLDLGFNGPKFTWNNRRGSTSNIQERIDRGLATSSWLSAYPNAMSNHLEDISFDHWPILLPIDNTWPKLKQ
ncbi:hypothetical protein P3X46_013414 [Hevea brasiliensis]|uniref:Endonuclease/exonuclease/phosphatase domain-containing protein n=1 Tax=Hevea brasiliensis TaxID=3981 RepID=A0ABQ9M3L9_HEVBR|nr:hypothetical protein P3X46_013414 [Hevea brasiliensis]